MTLYLPGAKVIPGRDGGSMLGGPRKVVWHTTENDPTRTSAANVAKYLVGSGNTVHLVWHPLTGEIVQMIPANRAGRGLENRAGGVETNRGGTYVIQIEVVGRASQPFTSGPMVGLPKILAWLASLGVPPVWSGTPDRSVTNWAKAGHFGHADIPEQNHTDPGRIDKTKLLEDNMPLDQSDIDKVAAAVWRYDQGGLKRQAWGYLQSAAAGDDVAAIAKALAAKLPAAFTQAQLEAALKTVFGSLDGKV